jgi:hypothetical protein
MDRARCEVQNSAKHHTANSAERTLTAVMAVPNPAVCVKLRTFPDVESVTARRGQTVTPCDRAAVSLPPPPLDCRDSQPIAASFSAAREDALSGCRHARSDRAPHGLVGARCSQCRPLGLRSRIVRATARKPCPLISSLPTPMRRIAARTVLSFIGRQI